MTVGNTQDHASNGQDIYLRGLRPGGRSCHLRPHLRPDYDYFAPNVPARTSISFEGSVCRRIAALTLGSGVSWICWG